MTRPQAPQPIDIRHQLPKVSFVEPTFVFRAAPRDEHQIEKLAREKLATLLRQIPDKLASQLDLPALLEGIRQQLRGQNDQR